MQLITTKATLTGPEERFDVLRDAMFCATKVYNGILWHLREEYKEHGETNLSASHLNKIARSLPRHKALYSDVVDTTRMEIGWAYRSFFALNENGHGDARPPGFRNKSRLSPLRYQHPNNGSVKIIRKRGKTHLRLSMGTTRQDGVRHLFFRLHTRPDADLSNLKNVQITYDTNSGRFEARLVVERTPVERQGKATVGVDMGENWLLATDFSDGTRYLFSGRDLKATRRYWQKVRSETKPPSVDNPRMSRRYRQISRKESRQVHHALHVISRSFVDLCVEKEVGTVYIGDLVGIRDKIDYGKRMNQRLHAWPYAKLRSLIEYKAALVGVKVVAVSEKYTSQTCPRCGVREKSNRKHRGWYSCRCGFEGQADLVGAHNIHRQVSGVPGSGCLAHPVVLVFNHHTVHEAASSRKSA